MKPTKEQLKQAKVDLLGEISELRADVIEREGAINRLNKSFTDAQKAEDGGTYRTLVTAAATARAYDLLRIKNLEAELKKLEESEESEEK